jgi:hypothetical protein
MNAWDSNSASPTAATVARRGPLCAASSVPRPRGRDGPRRRADVVIPRQLGHGNLGHHLRLHYRYAPAVGAALALCQIAARAGRRPDVAVASCVPD